MKQIVFLTLAIMAAMPVSRAQMHIFNTYAPHDDLDVAYIENMHIGNDGTKANATIIRATDDDSWLWLKETFRIASNKKVPDHNSNNDKFALVIFYVDRQDPTKRAPKKEDNSVDLERCYLLVGDYNERTITIFLDNPGKYSHCLSEYIQKKLSNF